MPSYLLAFNYWFHLLATVVWIGGLVVIPFIITPALRRSLEDEVAFESALAAIRRRFTPYANLSLVVLIVTGLLQMVSDKNYDGFLRLTNVWTGSILLKHVVVLGMLLVGAYVQWGLNPAVERARMLATRQIEEHLLSTLHVRERKLERVNLTLGLIVLLFTAIATAQ